MIYVTVSGADPGGWGWIGGLVTPPMGFNS